MPRRTIKKLFSTISIAIIFSVFPPTLVFSASKENATSQDFQSQKIHEIAITIAELTRQINDLQKKINALIAMRIKITVQIEAGDTISSGITITPVDITPPTISGLSIFGISSTTSIVSWNTDEPSTGFAYFATSTPIIRSTLAPFGSSIWNREHTLNLTGLKPTNTYYLVAESSDPSGNTTLSLQRTFTLEK